MSRNAASSASGGARCVGRACCSAAAAVAARLARVHPERCGEPVRMGDDTAGHHVGAITDPRRVMTDCRGGDAEFLQVIETGDAGPVAADTGIVEDRRGSMELRREVGGIDPAMRRVDNDRAGGLRPDAGDTVGDDDLSGHRCGLARRWPAIMPIPMLGDNVCDRIDRPPGSGPGSSLSVMSSRATWGSALCGSRRAGEGFGKWQRLPRIAYSRFVSADQSADGPNAIISAASVHSPKMAMNRCLTWSGMFVSLCSPPQRRPSAQRLG